MISAIRRLLAGLLLLPVLAGCQSLPPAPPLDAAPIRFLLTFDDGPNARSDYNTTLAIHAALADNDVQPGIKALFFVQTRNRNGGGTDRGREILRRAHTAGHVLGLHSGTARGHIRHTRLTPQEFEQSLIDGKADLCAITGSDPEFVRPTYWGYDDRTRAGYAAHGLKMLLTNVNGRDGIIYVLNAKQDPQGEFRDELRRVRADIEAGKLPPLDGVVPVVVTFHDLNPYTSRRMAQYLNLLVDAARHAGLTPAAKPYYDDTGGIVTAARWRATPAP
jgi:peptidoglycan/xylan/chitin deacetylase (PgdA/CDA1 family)